MSAPPPEDPYSRLDYRRLIAWPQRLRREAPLLLATFPAGARVLDLGCGTGEHARFLHARGREVVGVDASPSMLERAREGGEPSGLTFLEGDLLRLEEVVEGPFDGALCLGNTLPHLTGEGDLERLAGALGRLLRPGAPALFQLLNYTRILEGGERHLPLNFRPGDGGEIVFLRLMKPAAEGHILFFPTTLELDPEADPPVRLVRSKRVELRAWRAEELEDTFRAAGFSETTFYGSFERQPFEPASSRDIVLVARRAAPSRRRSR